MRTWMTRVRTLLNPLLCLNHSLIELSVLLRVRSNMNRIAIASLHTSGSIDTNSRWPEKEQKREEGKGGRVDRSARGAREGR